MSKSNNVNKTALVTGANSGIGYETAAALAEQGYGKVILGVRSNEKGEDARAKLVERTGKQVFDILVVDIAEPKSTDTAVEELKSRRDKINLLILNAGMSGGGNRSYNSGGVEMTFANIIGHHVLTMNLVRDGLLPSDSHIVVAGSEGARGDMMGMKPVDFGPFANEHFGGDLVKALEKIARYESPYEGKSMNIYVTSKVYTNWWAAVLSRKLPHGMVVNAVSPGSVPSTNFARDQSFVMRRVMVPMMNSLGRLFGMSWNIRNAADRYIEAGEFEADNTGHFYASPPGKMVGKMEIQNNEHFLNRDYQEAGWNAIVNLSGGVDYPTSAA
ncbi:MAG: SDR family NAD(P)-dependent oxidoreductase [Candidatus Heimdallarchaeota archaeon]|nr:SDR family NAD(P)-dependent oxidoreductase [Candidatus Heimdallarchaeota archaeon]